VKPSRITRYFLKIASSRLDTSCSIMAQASTCFGIQSQSFALIDHAGSDYSLCSIIYVDEKVPAIDVGPIFGNASRRVNEDSSKAIITSTLRRLAGTGRKTLEVKIWGYGELRPHGNGFTRFYSYSIGGGIRREKP
jgi:hypothetical protein